jgi:toxin HigB-1
VIKSFRHKALSEFWSTGSSARIDQRLQARILRKLDAIDAASELADLEVPGFNFHALRGFSPTRYTIHINGPWCVTFEFIDGEARRLDLEQYH